MANLALTTNCNLKCRFCFAGRRRADAPREFTAEAFERALDFLERSGIDQARLLGGEPTLHPRFAAFVNRALERGFRVLVFSNGLMPEAALRVLEGAPEGRVKALINARPAGACVAGETRRRQETLGRLGSRAGLGLTIDSPGIDAEFLLEWIEAYGLERSVRLGLAHPSTEGDNAHLHPRQYPAVGRRLGPLISRWKSAGVRVDLDCGFVPCMFPPETIAELGIPDLGRRCNPVLDVLPSGEAISCFPLASFPGLSLSGRSNAAEMRAELSHSLAPYREVKIYRRCGACERKDCAGGCLAAALSSRRSGARSSPQASITRLATGVKPPATRFAVPYIDQPLEFWQSLDDEFGGRIADVYVPLPAAVLGSGRPPQPSAHIEEFLRRAPQRRSVLVNPITLAEPVDEAAPRVVEALIRWQGEYGIHSATVSNLLLAARIRDRLPDLPLVASVLMDISRPNQVVMLEGLFQTLVPSGRIVRDLPALRALRAAFPGRVRLLVNEGCLPGCPYRIQHFHEMGHGFRNPKSLCGELLESQPWLRMTGCWVLPQHLHLYDGLFDEVKLAGRVTLRDPEAYRRVLGAYAGRSALAPNEIGGGPAALTSPAAISEEFFARTLECGQNCHSCSLCRDYFAASVPPGPSAQELAPGVFAACSYSQPIDCRGGS